MGKFRAGRFYAYGVTLYHRSINPAHVTKLNKKEPHTKSCNQGVDVHVYRRQSGNGEEITRFTMQHI